MTEGLSTLPIDRPAVRPGTARPGTAVRPRPAPAPTPRTPSRPAPRTPPRPSTRTATRPARPSLARRRWGFVTALVLMLATLPLQLLGLALVGIQLLSPSTDGSEPLFLGGVGAAQLLLLLAVATVGQLIGGGTDVWRRRTAFACLNGVLVVAAAGVAWAFLL